MRVLVVGASQGTGALAVKTALDAGHDVTAFARNPAKLVLEHARLTRAAGDFHQKTSVVEAVKGHDAVIITASATSLKGFKEQPRYFSLGTGYVVDGMKAAGVRRLVVLSAFGAGDSKDQAGWFLRTFVVGMILRLPFEDHDRQEAMVRESGLDWVIARPGRLTDGPARRRYVRATGSDPVPASISRADVADFLVESCTSSTHLGKAVQLGG